MKSPRSKRTIIHCAALAGLFASGVHAATVAHYRFEDGTDAAAFAHNTAGSVPDSSANAYNQTAWSPSGQLTYSSQVPAPGVWDHTTNSVLSNNLSLKKVSGGDIFGQDGSGLSNVTFSNITIEAYVRFDTLSGWQTFVGRDDRGNPGMGVGAESLLYFQKRNDGADANKLRVMLVNASNQLIQTSSTTAVATDTWYHVAAVGDAAAGTLKIFVNGVEEGSTTGFDGLLVPSTASYWTIGRGQFANSPGDQMVGYIDEVRFSDTALSPSQFLNVPEPTAAALGALGLLGLLRRRR